MIITLLTDFGTRDWFVPSLKGVILGITPRARMVDITHEIPPQDIRAGAFVLAAAAPTFPKGTIHVAVIDPGVGSRRKAIAVRTRNHFFIGPDNGVLSLATRQEGIIEVRAIENTKLCRQPVSRTFHGRDVFAPVAAHLARGIRFVELGSRLKAMHELPVPEPRLDGRQIRGEIVYIDHYGNLITNIRSQQLPSRIHCKIKARTIQGLSSGYSAVKRGEGVAVINSLDLLEIGVRNGHAAKSLKVRIGSPVVVTT